MFSRLQTRSSWLPLPLCNIVTEVLELFHHHAGAKFSLLEGINAGGSVKIAQIGGPTRRCDLNTLICGVSSNQLSAAGPLSP